MKKNKKISFWTYLKECICDFEKYPEMATRPATTIYKYFLKLIAIIAVIATIVSVYDISKKINTTLEILEHDIPEFTIEDNHINMSNEEEIIIENNDSLFNFILVDVNELDEPLQKKYDEHLKNNELGIAILKDKIEISIGSSLAEYSYENIQKVYNINNKEQILEYFNQNSTMLYVITFIMLFVYLYCAYIISTFMDAVILGALGYVTALILKIRIRFTAMIKMAIHGLTLPILLNSIYIIINSLTGIEIEYFSVMYMGISYVYIITSILMIKTDLIKRQSELTKIMEEQQNVKRELEQKEEEKREEKEQSDKDEQKKKEKNEENKKEEVEGEPQGENA